tara:strand:+ start:1660 stop:3132 length:1473 start_codon:yes stop_codon:yes gene_type:complete
MPEGVRVRFAPSPTGPLHVGGLRAALYNYLHAKKNNGTFILRVEDTDQKREVGGSYEYIEESLRWCGLTPDESPSKSGDFGPYKQSQRKNIYKKHIEVLVEKGAAYYAFDKAEDLDMHRKNHEKKGKTFIYNAHNRLKLVNSLSLDKKKVEKLLKTVPYVVRFKMPDNKMVVFEDEIRGKIEVSSRELDDKVLFKSDKMPTYHFANVVDDHMMKITHVIRGEEWLPSLPLHMLLYEAFGWEPPVFAHIPLILKPTGKGKLSKRDGEKFGHPVFPLEWRSGDEKHLGFKEFGVLPEALINYMALLGWSKEDNKEIYSLTDLLGSFEIKSVGKSGAKFDFEKLLWLNSQYIQKMSSEEIIKRFSSINSGNKFNLTKEAVDLIKPRIERLADIDIDFGYLFEPQEIDPSLEKKILNDDSKVFLKDYSSMLEKRFEGAPQLKEDLGQCSKIGFGKSMGVMRLCLVGKLEGPDLFELMMFLGKKEVLKRIRSVIA